MSFGFETALFLVKNRYLYRKKRAINKIWIKFDIHETLRIYLPGIFTLLLHKYFFSTDWNLEIIAILGIFAGLFLDTFHLAEPAHWFQVWYGNKFPNRDCIDFFGERKVVFSYRFKQVRATDRLLEYLENCDKDPRPPKYNPLSRALKAFDSTRYNESEIQQMRLLSGYGRLNFTIALLCFLGATFTLWHYISPVFNKNFHSIFSFINLNVPGWFDSIGFLIAGLIFMDSSFRLWKKSLSFEIKHYKTYSEEALKRLGEIIIMELDTGLPRKRKRELKTIDLIVTSVRVHCCTTPNYI